MQRVKILIGVTGSISAYKTATLIRLLIKSRAEVKVVMTHSAHDFITPLTLATLSKNPVLTDFIKNDEGEWNNHIELGLWADLMVIAPTTTNTISKMAYGTSDNLLVATYLSARCPVMIAPAMDLDMYQHPTTVTNLNSLKKNGVMVLDAEFGELASGLVGSGRMMEPDTIYSKIQSFIKDKDRLAGKKVLVNAGPTYETIDPVRFIGNHSSGKMGFAIAERFAEMGAEVKLVTGPSALTAQNANINLIRVQSAAEMFKECCEIYPAMDVGVLAAAVADYTPKIKADQKIKKQSESMTMELVKTKDIAKELGKIKRKNQMLVGFALETQNELKNAKHKLSSKNLDLIVLNSLQDEGAGFTNDTNKISIIDKKNNVKKFKLKNKVEVADDIIKEILIQIEN